MMTWRCWMQAKVWSRWKPSLNGNERRFSADRFKLGTVSEPEFHFSATFRASLLLFCCIRVVAFQSSSATISYPAAAVWLLAICGGGLEILGQKFSSLFFGSVLVETHYSAFCCANSSFQLPLLTTVPSVWPCLSGLSARCRLNSPPVTHVAEWRLRFHSNLCILNNDNNNK